MRNENISVSYRLPVSKLDPTQRRTRSGPSTYNTSYIIVKDSKGLVRIVGIKLQEI